MAWFREHASPQSGGLGWLPRMNISAGDTKFAVLHGAHRGRKDIERWTVPDAGLCPRR